MRSEKKKTREFIRIYLSQIRGEKVRGKTRIAIIAQFALLVHFPTLINVFVSFIFSSFGGVDGTWERHKLAPFQFS